LLQSGAAAFSFNDTLDTQNNRRVAFILPDGTISGELVGYAGE